MGCAAPILFTSAPALLTATGCAGDDCDSDTRSWGSCSQGDAIDDTHWESGPVTGAPFLDFHGERTWVLDPTPWMGSRQPIGFEADLAFSATPDSDSGTGFASASGNLAEFKLVQTSAGWGVQVLNDTCAQYYLRVVLTYPPLEGDQTLPLGCRGQGGT